MAEHQIQIGRFLVTTSLDGDRFRAALKRLDGRYFAVGFALAREVYTEASETHQDAIQRARDLVDLLEGD